MSSSGTDSDSDFDDEDDEDINYDDDEDMQEESTEKDEMQYRNQFHLAAKRGDTEAIGSLLMSSANVDVRDSKHNTPLHYAARKGHVDVVKLLLGNKERANAANLRGNTPFHIACQNDNFEVKQTLLGNNANVNVLNASGKTPLHIAAKMGYAEIVKAMIDHESEVNAIDRNGDTALHLAASKGHSDVVKVLLSQTVEMDAQVCSQLAVNEVRPADELSQDLIKNTDDGDWPSNQIAAECGNVEISNVLQCHSSAFNPVCKGQAAPHAQNLKNLIIRPNGVNVNACNNSNMTALHLACRNGHTETVEILLDNNAIVDIKEQSVETPFYLAAKNGHADVSDLLLSRVVCDFVLAYSPLHVAVIEGHTKVVEVILKHSSRIFEKLTKDGIELQESTKKGVMPVEFLKRDGRRVSAEIVWEERNTPIEVRRHLEGCPLRTALKLNPKMAQLMLNIDQRVYSVENIVDILRALILEVPRGFTLKEAVKYRVDQRKLAQFLINSSKYNVNYQDKELNTILHYAVQRKIYSFSRTKESIRQRLQTQIRNDMIQTLLEKGADFNMKNSKGETPLIIASEKGYCGAIRILFEWEQKSGMKLELDVRDEDGATALIKAAEMHHVSAVQLLLNLGASVSLYDYNGFTALHAAIYEPNTNWFDLHFFCKGLRRPKRKFDGINSLEIGIRDKPTSGEGTVELYTAIVRVQNFLEHNKETSQFKEQVVKLLLDNDETNVNANDFTGNTPLDLAVKSSKRVTPATWGYLENAGAIQTTQEPKDEVPLEIAKVDERGRNPLHRLMKFCCSCNAKNDPKFVNKKQFLKRIDVILDAILLRVDKFRRLAAETDDKGRTPLHYAVMTAFELSDGRYYDLVRALLRLGSNVNAADMYGKTPLHYAQSKKEYDFLIRCGANENMRDKYEYTPQDLMLLLGLARIKDPPIGIKSLYLSLDIAQVHVGPAGLQNSWNSPIDKNAYIEFAHVFNTGHVTELTRRKLVETIRIYSQSPRPHESSEETVWKIWTENNFIRLNRSTISQLKKSVEDFIGRLARGIKEKDDRFECLPILVGSAEEETKAFVSGDFDFNLKLIKFSQLCEPFPHPLGPKGYFQLRRKRNDDTDDAKLAFFFNSDKCLLTNEVNSRFQIILEQLLLETNFWKDERLFEWNNRLDISGYSKTAGLCKTVKLRLIHPIEDGKDGRLFLNISIDIVACVHVEDWWPEDPLPVGINPSVKASGSTFVFDQPRFDPTKPFHAKYLFSDTFARISFAPVESQIIKESAPLTKASYIVCKTILWDHLIITYQLKTSLLFCMEALNTRNETDARNEDRFSPKQLVFWVERIMFCFMEFERLDFFPCYFMSSFKQEVKQLTDKFELSKDTKEKNINFALLYPVVYDIYLDLCPDDAAIDIPIDLDPYEVYEERLKANHNPKWEQFDREELIRKLSSRKSF